MHPVATTGSRSISWQRSQLREPNRSRSARCPSGAASISRRSATTSASKFWHRRRAPPAAVASTDRRILIFIRRSRELGFSLGEIRALLRLGGPGKASCREVREVAARHLADIRTKLDDLKKLERLLSKTVARCSGKTAPDCPVLDILDIERTR